MQIENSVSGVPVLHHEACRVVPNSYPECRNFQFAPNKHYGFFFLYTLTSSIAFRSLYALFYQYYAEIFTFSVKKCLVQLLPTALTSKRLAENDIKSDVITSKRQPDIMHESRLTPPGER